jgi:hypothetical protein
VSPGRDKKVGDQKAGDKKAGDKKKDKAPPAPATGSGPGGRIEIGDIQAKLTEIRGDVEDTTDTARPYLVYAAVAGAVLVIAVAFLSGRKRGKRKSTWVEVRRL